jgi:uncharacterized protein (DUF1684 family)
MACTPHPAAFQVHCRTRSAWMLLILILTGCTAVRHSAAPPDWLAWQAKRHQSIAGTNGWLTLAGLHWLKEGDNWVGTGPTNQVVLPPGKAPDRVGLLSRSGKIVRFRAVPGSGVTVSNTPVADIDLVSDAGETPTRLNVAGLTFWVLDRGDRMGVRVRDPDSAARREFLGLTCFPYDPGWRLSARFESYAEPTTLRVPDVTGGVQELRVVGDVVFEHRGRTFRLQAVEEPGEEDLFVIFRDRTAGDATYGAGRYLYVERPTSGEAVVMDFNRAYTPPCGFTPYATCPLPPRSNWLPIAIRAGERTPPGHP